MKSAFILATLALAYGAPLTSQQIAEQQMQTEHAMSGVEGSMTNARQVQDTLNHRLQQSGGDPHANADRLVAFITGADSQIDNAIATVSDALAPFTFGVSKAIGNFLLGPFVQSVTNGAEVLLANLIGGGEDMIDAQMTARLTGNYSKLIALSKNNNVDTSKLEDLNRQITNTVSGKSKRGAGGESGLKGAITNIKQTVDTMKEDLEKHDGHAGQDVVNAAITGLDSQIDNLAATLASGLDGVTLGISGEIGDFLLGPIFQSLTNGAEVIISNVIGGSIDIVTDGTSKLLSSALSQLHSIGSKMNLSKTTMQTLEKTQKDVSDLKAPKNAKKEGKKAAATGAKKEASASSAHKAKPSATEAASVEKRATDADMSGANGSMTNYKQVQDTLNSQLKAHNGHAAQATINAFITGADSQIDNAIATVSDALAPFTLGISKAIGNVLLGPFVQSVTNGAEVLISNLIGGTIDGVADVSLEAYSKSLQNLSQLAEKYGVDANSKQALDKAVERVAAVVPKSN